MSGPDKARLIKVTVKLAFINPQQDGMPGRRDSEELQAIEERLALEMTGHGADIVLVVTGNNTCEYIGYWASHEWLNTCGPTVTARWVGGSSWYGV